MVRLGADRLIDHHLKNEVSAAFEVEAEMNPIQQSFFQACPAESLRNAKNPIKKENQDGDNAYGFDG